MAFEGLSEKLLKAFKRLRGKGKLSENDVKEAMREIKLALLEADVNYKVVREFTNSIQELAISYEVLKSLTPAQQIVKIVNDELVKLMGSENEKLNFSSKPPFVIMICGLQGSGKTTHSAKLAYNLKSKGKRPMLVACDIYRPAAIEQLKIIGQKADVFVFEEGIQDPISVAKNSVKYAKDYGYDVVILDTAGRLHIDEKLMSELKHIKQTINVSETLLVVDSMVGQNSVDIATTFNEKIIIDGIILTKLDGDTRGGAAISIKAVTGKPIKFVGIGEKITDLELFYPDRMASRILGMGDVLTLIEKAEDAFNEKQLKETSEKFAKQEFDLNDLIEQMKKVKKLGSLKSIISMLPGIGNKINDEQVLQGEREFAKIEALTNSMTKKERNKPSIINASRKRRIAFGSGSKVEDVNKLLKQFEMMSKMMRQIGGDRHHKIKKHGTLKHKHTR